MASEAPLSDSGNSQAPGTKRTPKVGVYVPRHRRGNDDSSSPSELGDSNQTSTTSTRQQNNSKPSKKGGSSKENTTEERLGNSSNNGEVQRRGRGKFMGPGGSSSSPTGESGGSSRNQRDNRSGGNRSTSNSSPSAAPSSPQPSAAVAAPRPPRGRDFDATVLRRYSDDENKPNSSFSRSGSFSSGRSNSNNNGGSNTRSSGRSQDSSSTRKPDRAEEGSWRREEPKKAEDQESEQTTTTSADDETASALSNQLEQVQLQEEGQKDDKDDKDDKDASGSSEEELEEWELALQDSDEDAIPSIENIKPSKSTKSHPAELLRNSATEKASKAGGVEVPTEDFYIIELYDFSPSIKTSHLTDMFAAYENKSGGFRIKWIDDTRALAIFESASIAKQAFTANLTNQIAKLRPYNGADKDTIRSAEGSSGGAYNGARPAKTDSVARRLVHGALGLRVRRTPEQIAEEKALVQAAREARDQQRQEQQRQRQEMDAIFDS
ncbi:R3H and coiled-coil domain-containing protein 1 [Mortierella sp. NVP85]|nr:R3H and coiled-coil domain-containing protein 1 [Mortierella sp. NVP85]